ncbi:COG4705 family protein [Actinacidiphila yeochonensis]|uniref:COG4705 family protein n=1 Tax=Actinacidiphila yeochonensis TaxID=89050 RepID=UPI0007C7031C
MEHTGYDAAGPAGREGLADPGGRAAGRSRRQAGRGRRAAPALSKVPEATVLFWIAKVLTTGMGETLSDFLARVLSPVGAGVIGLGGLVLLLRAQVRAPRYNAWLYWGTVAMVSVFGTMAADVVHVVAGVPYLVSASVFAAGLVWVLTAWYRSEGTLSIHSIRTPRRERYYWTTVLVTFALGTAVGDLTAGTFGLGYLPSGVMFAVLIAVPAVGALLGLNRVAAFWTAYVLTRPLGASFADWAGASTHHHGLGWGTGPVSLVLILAIAGVVGLLAVRQRADALYAATATGPAGGEGGADGPADPSAAGAAEGRARHAAPEPPA